VLANIGLSLAEIKALGGTPLAQDASLDELRRKDVGDSEAGSASARRIDPLIHFAGRTRITIGDRSSRSDSALDTLVRRDEQVVRSGHGQVELDYLRGVLRVAAPGVEAVSGALAKHAIHALPSMEVHTLLDPGHVILVPLDNEPIARSRTLLLQVMSEERAHGFRTEPMADGRLRIVDAGRAPWEVRRLQGRVSLRLGGGEITVKPLDAMGRPTGRSWSGSAWELEPETVYYLLEVRRKP
jgi:hypothetical protein